MSDTSRKREVWCAVREVLKQGGGTASADLVPAGNSLWHRHALGHNHADRARLVRKARRHLEVAPRDDVEKGLAWSRGVRRGGGQGPGWRAFGADAGDGAAGRAFGEVERAFHRQMHEADFERRHLEPGDGRGRADRLGAQRLIAAGIELQQPVGDKGGVAVERAEEVTLQPRAFGVARAVEVDAAKRLGLDQNVHPAAKRALELGSDAAGLSHADAEKAREAQTPNPKPQTPNPKLISVFLLYNSYLKN